MFEKNERTPVAEKLEPKWVLPDLRSPQEVGELERVADTLNPEDPEKLIQKFYEQAINVEIRPLDEEFLKNLENTDAADINVGDFDIIATKLEEMTAHDPLQKRDWQFLKEKIEKGNEMDMAVIVKVNDTYHLMSGNTRLMVSRALGKIPLVAIVNISE